MSNPNPERDERVRQSAFVVLSDKEVTRIGSQIVGDLLAQMGVRGTKEEREGANTITAALGQ